MIKIITDSTAYISEEFAKANDIKIVRLHTIIGDEDFIEGFPGSFEKVYKKIDEKVFFPKTSQPACGDFVDAFNEVVDNGDEAIVLILSSTLSGTINGATVAKGLCSCPDKISIVDSGTTGHNMWGIVCEVLECIKENKSREEIVVQIEKLKQNSGICFIPETFDALKRGGRVSTLEFLFGSILHIKPILMFKNGVLQCKKKVIGMGKAIAEIIAFVPENAKRLFVLKISSSIYFQTIKEKLQAKFKNIEVVDGDIGPVVGAHIGPAIGLSWIC